MTSPAFHIRPLSQPVDLAQWHAAAPASFPMLLQSSGATGWDVLLALPQTSRMYRQADAAQFLDDLAALPCNLPDVAALPFIGGWGVYAAYELLHQFEPTVPTRDTADVPVAALWRCPAAVLHHRDEQRWLLVAESVELIDELERQIATLPGYAANPVAVASVAEDDPQAFLDGVLASKRYVYEGDVFQVNLSRAWDITLASGSASDVYAQLRRANPAPFSAICHLGDYDIISSSPERLVKVREQIVETRPIAGTHPRSTDPQEDARLKEQLLATVKERAEHIMLVDLERNDLGRIAKPGTVQVDELMAVASYAYVHHIESNVRGELQDGVNPAQVLRALFPGGTITGCPKVRCMQIIRELEQRPRHAYTGSLGYISNDGSMDLNILIRTFLMHDDHLYFRAGAGIVADSEPERELQETRHKARGLLRALGLDQ
ncbi:aminodeoxychorismate synthase component I [Silvimonas sp.]|uniref:aminodeoxychorismate synthase component I n=1 Tax=Silvimonas sp. TaxID=2650811 RepID=UPI00284F795A|nr:aminodeoxychorismate synthase component I [Silvimonas sp.]MDR3426823.1 aminodeoxychorismate synthase component I [Silvimonas sp.]